MEKLETPLRDTAMQRRQWLQCAVAGGTVLMACDALGQTAARTPSPEVLAELAGAQWIGAARMRFFGFDIYDAQLWALPGFKASTYATHPFALELTYLRNLDGRAIAERSMQEMRRAGPLASDVESRWLAAMQETFPDVRSGDRITGMHHPQRGARFWFNSRARGTVPDPDFSRQFFGIWLAEWTSEPRLRTALLERAAS